MYRCVECGYTSENATENQSCPVCGKKMELMENSASAEQIPAETPKKKSKIGLWGIISTIVIVVIARVVGGMFGEMATEKMMENSTKNKMDEFIEKVEKYNPGTLTDTGYESEYWDVRWTPGEQWIKLEESELATLRENAKQTALSSAEQSIKGEDFSDELKEKYKSTIYGDIEAGYDCVSDNIYAGRAHMIVYSAYGIENEKDTETELVREFNGRLVNAKSGSIALGGKNYEYVDGVYSEGGQSINMKVYIRVEGVMVSMFQVIYANGYEEVVEDFENSISAY